MKGGLELASDGCGMTLQLSQHKSFMESLSRQLTLCRLQLSALLTFLGKSPKGS